MSTAETHLFLLSIQLSLPVAALFHLFPLGLSQRKDCVSRVDPKPGWQVNRVLAILSHQYHKISSNIRIRGRFGCKELLSSSQDVASWHLARDGQSLTELHSTQRQKGLLSHSHLVVLTAAGCSWKPTPVAHGRRSRVGVTPA